MPSPLSWEERGGGGGGSQGGRKGREEGEKEGDTSSEEMPAKIQGMLLLFLTEQAEEEEGGD